MEQLLLLPLLLLIHEYAVKGSSQLWWLALLPAFSAVGCAASLRLRVVWQKLALSALGGGAAFYLTVTSAWGPPFLGAAVAFAAVLQGATVARRLGRPGFYWFAICGYFVASFFFGRIAELSKYTDAILWAGLFCLTAAIAATNTSSLRHAALTGEKVGGIPSRVRRFNLVFLTSVFVIFALLGLLLGGSVLQGLVQLIGGAIRMILMLLRGSTTEIAPPKNMKQQPPPDFGPQPEQGWFAELLDMLFLGMIWLGIAVLIAGLLYVGYKKAGPFLRKWISKLTAFLQRRSKGEQQSGYTDEETSVFEWDALSGTSPAAWLRRVTSGFTRRRDDQEQAATNSEKVKKLYREWLRDAVSSGYEPKRHYTPQETLRDVMNWFTGKQQTRQKTVQGNELAQKKLVQLYDKAKYSGEEIGLNELEELRNTQSGKGGGSIT